MTVKQNLPQFMTKKGILKYFIVTLKHKIGETQNTKNRKSLTQSGLKSHKFTKKKTGEVAKNI